MAKAAVVRIDARIGLVRKVAGVWSASSGRGTVASRARAQCSSASVRGAQTAGVGRAKAAVIRVNTRIGLVGEVAGVRSAGSGVVSRTESIATSAYTGRRTETMAAGAGVSVRRVARGDVGAESRLSGGICGARSLVAG